MLKGMILLSGLMIMTAGCGNNHQTNVDEEGTGGQEKQEELNVDVHAEEIEGGLEVVISLENKTDQNQSVTFRSGHQFDLRISQNGDILYDFAEDMMFTQAIIEETIEPGESLTFSDTWGGYEDDTGEVTIQAKVLAEELDEEAASQSLTFPK